LKTYLSVTLRAVQQWRKLLSTTFSWQSIRVLVQLLWTSFRYTNNRHIHSMWETFRRLPTRTNGRGTFVARLFDFGSDDFFLTLHFVSSLHSRQYSSIWAPQPAAYDMALQDLNINSDRKWAALGAAVSAPIAEGEEASAFFTATAPTTSMQKPGLRNIMGLGRIAERAPLPPMPENASNSNDD
jgi:hypothetical protein